MKAIICNINPTEMENCLTILGLLWYHQNISMLNINFHGFRCQDDSQNQMFSKIRSMSTDDIKRTIVIKLMYSCNCEIYKISEKMMTTNIEGTKVFLDQDVKVVKLLTQ